MLTEELLTTMLTNLYSDIRLISIYVLLPLAGSLWAARIVLRLIKKQTV